MRLQIAAANWKMNKTVQEGIGLFNELLTLVHNVNVADHQRIIIAASFLHTYPLFSILAGEIKKQKPGAQHISLAVQNCSHESKGAFTGEVSAAMVKSAGARHVITGHSERRKYFKETSKMLAKKVDRVIENGMDCIYCCGETFKEREKCIHEDIVRAQLSEGLFHLTHEQFKHVIIAYEPVWAIGTGINATPQQAQEMHLFIRTALAEKFGKEHADKTSLLYGGSCNPNNAGELFACPDIDGGLIGGASLNAKDFIEIVKRLKQ